MPFPWTESAEPTRFRARFDGIDVAREDRVTMENFLARVKERPDGSDPSLTRTRVALLGGVGLAVVIAKMVQVFAYLRGLALGDGMFVAIVAALWLTALVGGTLGIRALRGITVGESLRRAYRVVFPSRDTQTFVDQFEVDLSPDGFRVAGTQDGASALCVPFGLVGSFETHEKGIAVHGNDGRRYDWPCTLLDADQHPPLAHRLNAALTELRADLRIAEADRGGYRGEEMLADVTDTREAARSRARGA